MATLFAFGDSFTQGVGLERHITPHVITPSRLAWPQCTADILGINVNNLGVGGHSNKAISYDVINNLHRISSEDIVVIMWCTGFYRNMILTDDGVNMQFCPSTNSDCPEHEISEFIYRYMSDKPNIIYDQSVLFVATDAAVRQKTHQVLHVMCEPLERENDVSGHDVAMWQHVIDQPWVYDIFQPEIGLFDRTVRPWTAEYDNHYSKEQHAAFSQRLSKVITQKFLTP